MAVLSVDVFLGISLLGSCRMSVLTCLRHTKRRESGWGGEGCFPWQQPVVMWGGKQHQTLHPCEWMKECFEEKQLVCVDKGNIGSPLFFSAFLMFFHQF